MANCQIGLNALVLEVLIPLPGCAASSSCSFIFVHLIVTVARLARPGGLRSVVAESALVRHQLLVLNRGRKRGLYCENSRKEMGFRFPEDRSTSVQVLRGDRQPQHTVNIVEEHINVTADEVLDF